jgi:phosphatidate cytidylyltransferase
MNNFRKRLVTAALFVAIILSAVVLNKYAFVAVFAFICGVCLWEFHTLLYYDLTGRKRSKRIIANVVLGIFPYLAVALFYLGSPFMDIGRLYAIGILLFLFVSVYYIVELASRLEKPFIIIAYAHTGVFYITVPCIMVVALSFQDFQFNYSYVLGILLLNWINDTGAFLVGSTIGKNLLFPRISPKKTWEGFLGGMIITLSVTWILAGWFPALSLKDWYIIAWIVVVFGSMGDLIESMFKRSLAVKDSGSFLPGHGGFLDRFDSFLFMLPFAAFYILIIK